MEIKPLQNAFSSLTLRDDVCIKEQNNLSVGKPHIIKRSVKYLANSNLYHLNNFQSKKRYQRDVQTRTQHNITVDLAIFLDAKAYHTFMPFLDNNEKKLRDIILTYVSNIQAAFHHPSLGIRVDISLVRLDFIKKQPSDLKILEYEYDVNEDLLFDLFRKYAKKLNNSLDDHNLHWDIGLYLTGRDLYTLYNEEDGMTADFTSVGISFASSVCSSYYSYAVVEFGAQGGISSSFASSLVAVRQIARV